MKGAECPIPRSVWQRPDHFTALGFGSGLVPYAPGTAGSLAALPFVLLLQQLPSWGYLLVIVAGFVGGVVVCQRTAAALGVHDHGAIVWDEWVGVWATLWLAPVGWPWLLGGFILFRLFDIAKPWPIRWIDQKVAGGIGIMLDDLLAALYGWAVLQVVAVWLA